MSIRVLLIEDHFLARMALRSVLNGRADISLVAEASDGASGVEMYRQLRRMYRDGSPIARPQRV